MQHSIKGILGTSLALILLAVSGSAASEERYQVRFQLAGLKPYFDPDVALCATQYTWTELVEKTRPVYETRPIWVRDKSYYSYRHSQVSYTPSTGSTAFYWKGSVIKTSSTRLNTFQKGNERFLWGVLRGVTGGAMNDYEIVREVLTQEQVEVGTEIYFEPVEMKTDHYDWCVSLGLDTRP